LSRFRRYSVHGKYSLYTFIQRFVVGSERRTCFETQCVIALQGHPRSLILTPIESGYATTCKSSIETSVLSCPVSEILQVSGERDPPLFDRILGVFPLDYIGDVVAPRSEDPKLIVRVINLELVRPICSAYITDRRTDGRLTIALVGASAQSPAYSWVHCQHV